MNHSLFFSDLKVIVDQTKEPIYFWNSYNGLGNIKDYFFIYNNQRQ